MSERRLHLVETETERRLRRERDDARKRCDILCDVIDSYNNRLRERVLVWCKLATTCADLVPLADSERRVVLAVQAITLTDMAEQLHKEIEA